MSVHESVWSRIVGPRVPREEIIRRCQDVLDEHEGQHVLLGDLVAASQVSERTLRTAFNEYFGVGPARYLQLRQLRQVHRTLQTADPTAVTVSDVLVAHGEWQFSRFAARYRKLFGQLPSETLRGSALECDLAAEAENDAGIVALVSVFDELQVARQMEPGGDLVVVVEFDSLDVLNVG